MCGRISKIADGILSLLYPDSFFCTFCNMEFMPEDDDSHVCPDCLQKIKPNMLKPVIPHLTDFCAGLIYDDATSRAVQRLKYNGCTFLAPRLAEFMRIPEGAKIDAIVPIPLHVSAQKKRGYNQSALLARQMSVRFNIPVIEDAVIRVKKTKTQTELAREDRIVNMQNAFAANKSVDGKSILLIDDVCTTGSTLSSCAKTLIEDCGAGKVYGSTCCIAYNPKFTETVLQSLPF